MNAPVPPLAASQRVVTWRSVLLGLVGVAFICGLTPYNDFVVNNTYLVGNFLPIGLLLFFIVFVMLINAPLNLWARRYALSAGELAVALSMTLVSCGLPSSGLMRYLPSALVGVWTTASSNGDYRASLRQIDPPEWLFPSMTIADRYAGQSDEVISHFQNATPGVHGLAAVPWSAWVKPVIGWGVFLVCLYGAVLCVTIIVRRQWVENERLAFPLASIYLSLVEEPEPGRALNPLFRSMTFWVCAGLVFAIHSINALHQYLPQTFPEVPVKYNLRTIFTDAPWHVVDDSFKAAAVFFCVVGIVYFIQSNVAFSLWASYLIMQVGVRMIYSSLGTDFPANGSTDLIFGSLFPFLGTILWIGRHHWAMVFRQMFRGHRGDEPVGRYLSYRVAGWALIVCLAGVVGWLCVAGLTLASAMLWVSMFFLILIVLTKIVAETGLIFVQIPVTFGRPYSYLLAGGFKTSLKSFWTSNFVTSAVAYEMRESPGVFMSHALRTGDEAAYDRQPARGRAVAFTLCLILALLVGFFISGASALYGEYNHAVSLDGTRMVNDWTMTAVPDGVARGVTDYKSPGVVTESHSRAVYFGTGFGVTTVLSYLRLRFVAWPFHPVGFLLSLTMPMKKIWLSILIGWIAKVLIVRFGGTNLYRAARPAFIGVIIGEAGAAAFWLVVSLVRVSMGLNYEAIQLLPR